MLRSVLALAAATATLAPFVPLASGQFPAESTLPRDKRPNRRIADAPTGPAPRTASGKVDLSGVWGYSGHTSDLLRDYDVGAVPFTELGERLFLERQANQGRDDPEARCLPTGVPRRDPYPSKIVQLEDELIILYEGNIHSYRVIKLNVDHPDDPYPTWYGNSVGHWQDDDTLIVDTIGFNGKTWLDLAGHPTSDQLHVIERFSRPDFGHLHNQITVIDPVNYTEPLEILQITPLFDGEMLEYICTENEKDSQHLDSLR